jgi:hypothetical protein
VKKKIVLDLPRSRLWICGNRLLFTATNAYDWYGDEEEEEASQQSDTMYLSWDITDFKDPKYLKMEKFINSSAFNFTFHSDRDNVNLEFLSDDANVGSDTVQSRYKERFEGTRRWALNSHTDRISPKPSERVTDDMSLIAYKDGFGVFCSSNLIYPPIAEVISFNFNLQKPKETDFVKVVVNNWDHIRSVSHASCDFEHFTFVERAGADVGGMYTGLHVVDFRNKRTYSPSKGTVLPVLCSSICAIYVHSHRIVIVYTSGGKEGDKHKHLQTYDFLKFDSGSKPEVDEDDASDASSD